jgi:hypothetical protein
MGELLKAAEFYLKAGERHKQRVCILKVAQVEAFSIVFSGGKRKVEIIVDELRSLESTSSPFFISLLSKGLNEEQIRSYISIEQIIMSQISSPHVTKDPSYKTWIQDAARTKILFDSISGLIRKLTGMHYGDPSEEVEALFALRRSSSDEERLVSRVVVVALKIVGVNSSSWSIVSLAKIVPAAIDFLKTLLKELIPNMLRDFSRAMGAGICNFQVEYAIENRGYLIFSNPCEDPRFELKFSNL